MEKLLTRILLVEDDEDDYIITKELLSDISVVNYELDWTASYQDALRLLVEDSHDIYLIDYRLGPLNGLDLAKEALAQGCKAPIILLTGQGGLEVDLQAMQSGVADYLVKGKTDSQILERTIRYAIERNREKEELLKSEERYRSLFESIQESILISDKDGKLIGANSAAGRLLGYQNPEALIGLPVRELIPESAQRKDLMRNLLENGVVGAREYTLQRKDGKHLYVLGTANAHTDNEGNLSRIEGVFTDITERKLDSQKIIKAENQYRQLMENSPLAIIVLSTDGKIEKINNAFMRLFGLNHETMPEIIDKYNMLEDEQIKQLGLMPLIEQAFEGNPISIPPFNYQTMQTLEDIEISQLEGRNPWLQSQIYPINDDNGNLLNIVCLHEDISEQKNSENIIQRQLDDLRILQEVSAICLENVDEHQTISLITETIGRGLYSDHFGVMLLDNIQGVLRIHPSYQGLSPEDYEIEVKLGEGVIGKVAKTNKAIRIDDVAQNKDYISPKIRQSSELCVPISVNGQVFGVLNTEAKKRAAFSVSDEQLLSTVADQLAVALQKSRLYKAEKERRIEAETQREASALLTTSLDLDEVLKSILTGLNKVIISDNSSIHLFDMDCVRVVASSGFSDTEDPIGFSYEIENQLVQDIVNSKTPLVIEDAAIDPRFEYFGFINPRGWMGIPLIEKDTVFGILTVDSVLPNAYKPEDAEIIKLFANNAAAAIVKARLFEDEKKRRLGAEIQQEISSTLTRTLDMKVMLENILISMQRGLDFDSAGILLQENGYLKIVATHGILKSDKVNNRLVSKDHAFYQEILKTKSVLILENVENDDRFEDFGIDEEIQGWMGVPLIDQGTIYGYVSFDSKIPGKFTHEMGRSAQVLVNQTSAAITKVRLFEETQLSLKRLEALHDIDHIITSSVDLSFAIKQIMQIIVSQLEIDTASVVLYDSNNLTFKPVDTVGLSHNSNSQRYFGNGYVTKVALERKILRVEDKDELIRHFSNDSDFIREGYSAYIGIPLIAKGDIKGVLELFQRSPLEDSNEWNGFLQAMATQLAIAIDNSQMFDNLQKSNIELSHAYDATIKGWAQALELKDMETEGHSRRVVDLTLELAQVLGISAEKIVHVRRGALLHDIGKMGVPDAILHKPGKLTEEEWEIMREHPTYAMEWLSSIDYLEPALDVPYCHHEKWDGSGYPQGLRGEEIPLSARIFALVDVWDALRSDRPYRKAWSKEKTIAHIQEQSGKHFDPMVVEKFLKLLKNEEAKLNNTTADKTKT